MKIPAQLKVGARDSDPIDPIWRGDPWVAVFRFAGKASWDGDYTWASKIAPAWNTTGEAATVTTAVDGTDFVVTVRLSGAQTLALTRSAYVQDLQATAGGSSTTWFHWKPVVLGQVT
jgi:hypothetical protein